MKVLLITDQHFGIRNDNVAFLDYYEKFYENVVFPYIDENKIDTVIDLGDTFERRKFVNFFTLSRSKEMWFDQLESRNINYYYIVGNHTAYFKNTISVNTPELVFSRYKNFHIIQSPQVVNIGGLDIVLMPWICQDNQEDAMKLIDETRAQMMFGHLEIVGFEMHRGVYVSHGLESYVFNKFELVASGHLHHRSSRGNIHYLGCPYEMDWSDYGDQKGFHIFDTETRDLTFVPNPYIMFHKVYYDDAGHSSSSILDFDAEAYRNTYVKVIVKEKTNHYWFDLFLDKLEASDPLNIEVVESDINLALEDESDVVDGAEDTMSFLKKYVTNIDADIDKNSLSLLLTDLYSEALSLE